MAIRSAVLRQSRRITPGSLRSVTTISDVAAQAKSPGSVAAAIGQMPKHDRSVPTRTTDEAGNPLSATEIFRQGMDFGPAAPEYQQLIPTKPVASMENSLVLELQALAGTELHLAFKEERRKAATAVNILDGIGSQVRMVHTPEMLMKKPVSAEKVTLEMLMAAQTHMGHNAKTWNPDNSRFIYGVRHGIHIISLEQTLAHLRRAARVVEEVAYRGGTILFVGTRKGQMELVASAAKRASACHLFTRWTPGSITNRDRLLEGLKVYAVNEKDELVEGFEKHVDDSRPLTPDLVVCLNPLENYTLLYECGLVNVPTIGIIDTDADASWVTYPIPANDDSLRSTTLISSVLGKAGQTGNRRRLAEAAEGVSTWETPFEVARFLEKTIRHKKASLAEEIRDAKSEGLYKTKKDGGDVNAQAELWRMVEQELLGDVEPLAAKDLEKGVLLPNEEKV